MDLPLNAMTPRVRRALVVAHEAALAGHDHIGTEHVLIVSKAYLERLGVFKVADGGAGAPWSGPRSSGPARG